MFAKFCDNSTKTAGVAIWKD